ncbi:hypothetical protein OIV83_002935 [Microbotryomycetes sp. JL201]|nr:hypothetical protein OIV83_002935 [Microbotryomycetes sp. JL201]
MLNHVDSQNGQFQKLCAVLLGKHGAQNFRKSYQIYIDHNGTLQIRLTVINGEKREHYWQLFQLAQAGKRRLPKTWPQATKLKGLLVAVERDIKYSETKQDYLIGWWVTAVAYGGVIAALDYVFEEEHDRLRNRNELEALAADLLGRTTELARVGTANLHRRPFSALWTLNAGNATYDSHTTPRALASKFLHAVTQVLQSEAGNFEDPAHNNLAIAALSFVPAAFATPLTVQHNGFLYHEAIVKFTFIELAQFMLVSQQVIKTLKLEHEVQAIMSPARASHLVAQAYKLDWDFDWTYPWVTRGDFMREVWEKLSRRSAAAASLTQRQERRSGRTTRDLRDAWGGVVLQ